MALAVAGHVQGVNWGKSLIVSLDSGSTASWLNWKLSPEGVQSHMVKETTGSALAGTFASKEQVCVNNLVSPEFHSKQVPHNLQARAFNVDCHHNVILGHDILQAFGIKLDFNDDPCTLNEDSHPVDVLVKEFLDNLEVNDEDILSSNDNCTDLLESKHDGVSPHEIVDFCTHLIQEQQDDLSKLFSKFEKSF